MFPLKSHAQAKIKLKLKMKYYPPKQVFMHSQGAVWTKHHLHSFCISVFSRWGWLLVFRRCVRRLRNYP